MNEARGHLSWWYLIPPFVTVGLIMPVITGLFPFYTPDNLNIFQILIVSPFYLGLAAAPGWLYVWSGRYQRRGLSLGKRLWAEASLWAALIASIGGYTTIFIVLPFLAVIASTVACILLLARFYGWRGGLPAYSQP